MTDKEIKKALELCDKDPFYCVNCPFYKNRFCRKELKEKSLDLINRQQTAIDVYMQENDRLKTAYIQVSMDRDTMLEDLQFRTNQVIEQQAEIERLQNDLAISRKETKRYATRRRKHIKNELKRMKEMVGDK